MKKIDESIKTVLWFILVLEIFIVLLALLFGYSSGYKNSLVAHGILGLITGFLALSVLALVILVGHSVKLTRRILSRGNRNK